MQQDMYAKKTKKFREYEAVLGGYSDTPLYKGCRYYISLRASDLINATYFDITAYITDLAEASEMSGYVYEYDILNENQRRYA